MSDPRCWRRPGSSPPLADPAITVVSLIATGDGDLACDDSFVPPRDRPRIHAGRQFRVLGAGTCRSPHHKTGADCGPASPKRARPRPRRKRRPTYRHPTRTPRQQHSAPVPHTRRRNMPEPTPRNRRRVRPASPAAKLDARPKRTAVPTGTPRTPRQQHARAPHPERDAHRPSYERPNGSSPAGRGAAGPYPTTLARSAAQNSAGCSITLGTAIR